MSVADIDKIKERSKSRDREGKLTGPWITDWPEMAKKTVIRRHIKLVPLSIEMATAAAAEDRAFAGESQVGLFLDTQEAEYAEVEGNGEPDPAAIAEFDRLVNEKGIDPKGETITKCIQEIGRVNNQTVEAVKAQASTPENFPKFWGFWLKHNKKSPGRPKKPPETPQAETSAGTQPQGQASGENPPQAITEATMGKIIALCEATGISSEMICEDYQVSGLSELTEADGLKALDFYGKAE
jgi:hypothetical protein